MICICNKEIGLPQELINIKSILSLFGLDVRESDTKTMTSTKISTVQSIESEKTLDSSKENKISTAESTLSRAEQESEIITVDFIESEITQNPLDNEEHVKFQTSSNKSYDDLKSLEEIVEEFANLTKAWSPMMLSILTCESIMLINTGFVVSKYMVDQVTKSNGWETATMIYLMVYSVIIIISTCIVAEGTYNKVKDYSHKVR